MKYVFLFAGALWAWGLIPLAYAEGMSILAVSKSGKSVILPIGSYDGLREGEKGRFYHQAGQALPLRTLVATGMAVKVQAQNSYWHLDEIGAPELIKPGQKIDLLRQSIFLRGRNFPVKQRKVVLNSNQDIKGYLQGQKIDGVDEKIFRVQKGQQASRPLKLGPKAAAETINATVFDEWEEPGLEKLEYLDHEVWAKQDPSLNQTIDEVPIQEEERDKAFARETNGMANKINHLERGLYGLYDDEEFTDGKKKEQKTMITTLTGQYQEDRALESRQARETMRRLGATDVRWSTDLSDQELRDYFVEMGITRERFRQQYALNNLLSHEIYFHFGVNLYGEKNSAEETSKTAFLCQVGYELFLGRFKFSWHPYTLSAGLEWGTNGYVMADKVVSGAEKFWHFMARWYPWHYPTTIKQWPFWVGAGFEGGTSKISADNFTAPITPFVAGGIKYRFTGGDERFTMAQWGMGVEALLSWRKRRFDGPSDQASQYTRDEAKIYLGTNVFF